MKKSEIKTVLCLLAVVILLAAVLAVMSTDKESKEAVKYLLDVNENEITKLSFANGTDYVHLEKNNGTWKMSDDDTFKVDQDAASTLIKALTTTKVAGTIEVKGQSQLNDYSLLSPQCMIEYSCSSGKTGIIRIGTMSSLTEQLYVLNDENAETVYITSNEIAQAFSCEKLDLLRYPDIPKPEKGLQNEVSVTNVYGDIRLYKENGEWYLDKGDDSIKIDEETAYNYYFLTWDMHWRGRVEHDSKNLDKYDLGKPRITYELKYTEGSEEKTFTLELGSSLPDGTCYAKIKDNNDIFLLDSLMADWLESTKEEDMTA